MSNRENLQRWIENTLSDMPVGKEDFFKRLWNDGKIHYDDDDILIDDFDEISSKLACTALDKRVYLLIVLPDLSMHRGSMIFCTILVKYAVKCIIEQIPNKRILYFGTTLRFKFAIESTYVGNLPISRAFSYTQSSGKYDKYNDNSKSLIPSEYLPEVICVYNPASPQQYINSYKPDVIIIDCGIENEIEWLPELLRYCKKKGIPLIGWTKSSFSSVIEYFDDCEASIFYYPKIEEGADVKDVSNLFLSDTEYQVTPIVMSGNEVSIIDRYLTEAKNILRQLNIKNNSRLRQDALRLAWKYLRAVEGLSVPVNIYNAEARSFWRTYSLEEFNKSLSGFINQLRKSDSNFATAIDNVSNIVDNILLKFNYSDPPIWNYLSDVCMDRPPEGQVRIIIFPTKSQRQLFSYTLLSRVGITEDELFADSRVKLKTLKEYHSINTDESALLREFHVIPIFIGLPNLFNKSNFFDLFLDSPELLVYPHQIGFLKSLIYEYNQIEKAHLRRSIKTLKRLSGRSDEINIPSMIDRCHISKEIRRINIEGKVVNHSRKDNSATLLNVGDFDTELATLLESGDENEIDYLSEIDITDRERLDGRQLFIENCLEFKLEGNHILIVGPNDQLNINNNGKVESVYAKAITPGKSLLLIENQPRQNLYDLILSRVHNHPSLEIHMAMLKKWREEFYLGYLVWKEHNSNKGLADFLQLLQQQGSDIVTPLTVSNWLNGYTMRPQDELDMYRIGEILEVRFIKENYKRISAAASRIIGMHISLSRKLNEWLSEKALNSEKEDMEIIDKEIGLTFGELRSSLKILKVEAVIRVDKPILVSSLGKLEKLS